MPKPKQTCLECANFGSTGVTRELRAGAFVDLKACPTDPIPRLGTCGACDTAFVGIQPTLEARA